MKRVLIAGVLGGLLLLGTPTLAASAEREGRRSEKSSDHRGDKGDRHDRAHRGDRHDRGDHDGRHRHHRHHRHHYDYGDYYYGGHYGHPYYGGYYGGYPYYYGGYSSGPRHGQVIVSGMAYNPPEVHIGVGERVLWLFQDGDIPHTVTADNGSFDSGHKVNDEFQLRFDQPGTYSYHCTIHPELKNGRVIVH